MVIPGYARYQPVTSGGRRKEPCHDVRVPCRGRLPERLLVRLISLAYGRFEPEIRHLDEVCGRGGTMVDVGGWYGPWTRRLLGRADQVVVIEPTPLHHVAAADAAARRGRDRRGRL